MKNAFEGQPGVTPQSRSGPRIFVAYASTCGATRRLAEQIALALRQAGHLVDVHPVAEVASVKPNDAGALGAAKCAGTRLSIPAREFVESFEEAIKANPLRLFADGPLVVTDGGSS